MGPIVENAQLLSNDQLAKWLIEDFPFRIQLSSVLPFLPVVGDRLRYATTGPLTPGAAIGFGDLIPEDTKCPREANRAHQFAQITTQFRVTYKAQDIFSSNANDQVAVQMALAVRELLYRFWTLFESGDAAQNADEFDGLLRLVDPANVIDLEGGPLTLETLDLLTDRVRTNDGRGAVLFTSGVGKRAIDAAHWVRGLSPEYREMAFPCPDDEYRTQRVVSFDGAPVYVNDLNQVWDFSTGTCGEPVPAHRQAQLDGFIPRLATNIWCMVLGEGNLHGIKPANAMDIITRSTILADASTLVYHLAMPTGIALGSSAALALIKNAAIPVEGLARQSGAGD